MNASKRILISNLRSKLVFSVKNTRNFSYLTIASCLIASCGMVKEHTSPETYNTLTFSDGGSAEAQKATVYYSQGQFPEAEKHITKALGENPRQPQALLVGALVYEQLGRPNKARQFYEDLSIYGGEQTSILGTSNGIPERMSDIAQKRLRLINVKQSQLVIEDQNGTKVFNISNESAKVQSRSAIEEALFLREKRNIENKQPSTAEELKSVEVLFNDQEQNVISRFLILKELAEKDLITKEEFLNARMANIGGLLPLTNTPPALGVEKSVPSPDMIIERINVLKDAVESRAITPREYSAERDVMIEALLPPTPRQRLKNKAPSKDILGAAKDLRKLEILYDLNLITSKEKAQEKSAVEKHLGLNRAEPAILQVAPAAPIAPSPAAAVPTITPSRDQIIESRVEIIEDLPTPRPAPQPLIPEVSSPF